MPAYIVQFVTSTYALDFRDAAVPTVPPSTQQSVMDTIKWMSKQLYNKYTGRGEFKPSYRTKVKEVTAKKG